MDNTVNATLTDYVIPDVIDDTISQLRWFPEPTQTILASGGWDARVRIWQVNYAQGQNNTANIQSGLLFNTQLPEPILSIAWQQGATCLFSGCADGSIYQVDTNTNAIQTLGKHDAGVKEMAWIPQLNCLLTGGWDGKLNFWDLRSSNPAMKYDMGRKIYSMSAAFPLLVVGMADRQMAYFNMNNMQNFQPVLFESHLKYQTRKVACFTEKDGYAIGSIEGRVAIKYIDLNKQPEINPETKSMNSKDDFAFRCHRSGDGLSEVYPVNDIAFNPVFGTFCTGGGDGTWIIWDKDSRSRLKQGTIINKAPITALDYSANGDLLAYASGYDWAKGVGFENSFKPALNIHYCPDSDKKKKQKK